MAGGRAVIPEACALFSARDTELSRFPDGNGELGAASGPPQGHSSRRSAGGRVGGRSLPARPCGLGPGTLTAEAEAAAPPAPRRGPGVRGEEWRSRCGEVLCAGGRPSEPPGGPRTSPAGARCHVRVTAAREAAAGRPAVGGAGSCADTKRPLPPWGARRGPRALEEPVVGE